MTTFDSSPRPRGVRRLLAMAALLGAGGAHAQGCPGGSPAVLSAPDSVAAGEPATLGVVLSGTGPYTLRWDFEGDGAFDRTDSNVTQSLTVAPRYPRPTEGVAGGALGPQQSPAPRVVVEIADPAGCVTQLNRTLTVTGPAVDISAQGLGETCGNGDADIDPGEIWTARYRARTTGSALRDATFSFAPIAARGSASASDTRSTFALGTLAERVDLLSPGRDLDLEFDFFVDGGAAACADRVSYNFVGAAAPGARAAGDTLGADGLLTQLVGGGADCDVVVDCAIEEPAAPALVGGLYADSARLGNGMAAFLVPGPGSATTFFGLWFTATVDRAPTWYLVQGTVQPGSAQFSVQTPIRRVRRLAAPGSPTALDTVGFAYIASLPGDRGFVMHWDLNVGANVRSGSEVYALLYPERVSGPDRTGAWYDAGDPGWGVIFDEHLRADGSYEQVAMSFIHGADGEPRWTLGAADELVTGAIAQRTYRVHCPQCASLADFGNAPIETGTLTRGFSRVDAATLDTAIVLPAPFTGRWDRNQVAIQPLTPLPALKAQPARIE
jgi:hypothetical protein